MRLRRASIRTPFLSLRNSIEENVLDIPAFLRRKPTEPS